MNHSLVITVDGYSWVTIATTHHNGKIREVSAIACIDVPTRVLGALDDHVLSPHDVLEVVRQYLNDTAAAQHGTTCGPIEISWHPLDAAALRADLTGKTYRVKLTDCTGVRHTFETGAANQSAAFAACADLVQQPIRSSVVQPLGY
jgi:hypothetical protein